MVDHPNHVVYMIHPLRGLYETYRYFGLPLQPDRSHPAVARLLPLLEQPPDRDLLPELFAALHDVLAAHGSDDPAFASLDLSRWRLVHFLDRVGLDPEHVRDTGRSRAPSRTGRDTSRPRCPRERWSPRRASRACAGEAPTTCSYRAASTGPSASIS